MKFNIYDVFALVAFVLFILSLFVVNSFWIQLGIGGVVILISILAATKRARDEIEG